MDLDRVNQLYIYTKMAHSFIGYHGENIRVNDFDLFALVFFLKRIAFQNGEGDRLNDMFVVWIDSIEHDGAGNIDLRLDMFMELPGYFTSLLETLRKAKNCLNVIPEIMSKDFMRELIQIDGINFGDYKKSFLENILDLFERILGSAGEHLIHGK